MTILRLIPLVVLCGCAAASQPVSGEGLKNTHRLSGHVLRGGQPTREGMASLAAMGVKKVVNLRAEHSDRELAQGCGVDVVDVPMTTWKAEHETIVAFLKAVAFGSEEKFFH
ncbi:MAG: hypothetical protein HY716_01875 [Planctomycetes bacterium]|nr:hypothetical protein [Planctomycetota bacterium]